MGRRIVPASFKPRAATGQWRSADELGQDRVHGATEWRSSKGSVTIAK